MYYTAVTGYYSHLLLNGAFLLVSSTQWSQHAFLSTHRRRKRQSRTVLLVPVASA